MQLFSGILFALAMALAVALGGQTIDYTWGPALLALAAAMLTALPGLPPREGWPRMTRGALVLLLAAVGWILWRCAGSPVREFARSDALLAGAMLVSCLWAASMPPGGRAICALMIGLALLALANLGIGLHQLNDRAFAWPFASRPSGLPSGLFGHYNHFADFSLVVAVILAARAQWSCDPLGMKLTQSVGAMAAVACVLLSGSRGGGLSLATAFMVYLALWTVRSWRDKSPHRKILSLLCIIVPLLLALTAGRLLQSVEHRRGMFQSTGSVSGTADNLFRLTFVGIAFDIAAEHSWQGGGSRSFGWEKYAKWDPLLHGSWDRYDDDLIHNEIAQVATDYGWIGVAFVASAVFAAGLSGLSGMLLRETDDTDSSRSSDAATIGALSALAGTLVHSNFSFVTHTMPGAIYLGLALGMALPRHGGTSRVTARPGWTRLARAACLPLFIGVGIAAFQATRVYHDLWPVWFSRAELANHFPEESLSRIDRAISRWPAAELAGRAADITRTAADSPATSPADRTDWLDRTATYYSEAARLNPFDPEWAINGANLLSLLGRDEEAEALFMRSIDLQGGMESMFRARYYYGRHLYHRWYRLWTLERREEEALHQFLLARDLLDQAKKTTPGSYWGTEGLELRAGLEKVIFFMEQAKVKPRAPTP